MVHRTISPTKSNSYFLFGARGTGKTTLLRSLHTEENSEYIDLLDPEVEDAYARHPSLFENRILATPASKEWIIVDEIQRAPRLLDCVHRLIENTHRKFILTVSSGRKLRRGAANLLAGRAFIFNLYPLTHREFAEQFSLERVLQWGSLPKLLSIDNDADRARYLKSYAHAYLREEIVAEQLVRNLDPFRHFLEIAAQSNGKIINYTKIAFDTGVDVKTIQNYFSILEDTLIGLVLPPFHRSIRKRQRAQSKFYFFDIGVKRSLENSATLPVVEGTYAYGEAFEHFIILELFRLSSYAENDWKFSYLRTGHGVEIDCIIERPGKPLALIEIKSTSLITERDTVALASLMPDLGLCEAFVLSRDPITKKIGDIRCLPWQQGFTELGL